MGNRRRMTPASTWRNLAVNSARRSTVVVLAGLMLFSGLVVAVVESQEGAIGFCALRRLDFVLLDQPFDGANNRMTVAQERFNDRIKRCPRGAGRFLRRQCHGSAFEEFGDGRFHFVGPPPFGWLKKAVKARRTTEETLRSSDFAACLSFLASSDSRVSVTRCIVYSWLLSVRVSDTRHGLTGVRHLVKIK